MNSSSKNVESTLGEILAVITPSEQDWVIRHNSIRELQQFVTSVPRFEDATVEPFGSFVSNLFTMWGDLDLSIHVPAVSYSSFGGGKERKKVLLRLLHNALRGKGRFFKFQYIHKARIPILKFENHRGITCDVSIENIEGQIKSKILLWLTQIDGRFREMVLLVKEWANTHDINCPTEGSFNSYSLCLLVIFHLQTCQPAILPPLKEIYPTNVVDDLTGFYADAEERVHRICALNIASFRSHKYRRPNPSSLDELFISFIRKFANINSRASGLAICPFTGTCERRSNMRWLTEEFSIIVEDPFEQQQNSSRSVDAKSLERIFEAFRTTQVALMQGDWNKHDLLKKLVRPSVAEQIPKSPTKISKRNQFPIVYRSYDDDGDDDDDDDDQYNPSSSVMQNQRLKMPMAPKVNKDPWAVVTDTLTHSAAAKSSEDSSQYLSGGQKAVMAIGALAAVIGAGAMIYKGRPRGDDDDD